MTRRSRHVGIGLSGYRNWYSPPRPHVGDRMATRPAVVGLMPSPHVPQAHRTGGACFELQRHPHGYSPDCVRSAECVGLTQWDGSLPAGQISTGSGFASRPFRPVRPADQRPRPGNFSMSAETDTSSSGDRTSQLRPWGHRLVPVFLATLPCASRGEGYLQSAEMLIRWPAAGRYTVSKPREPSADLRCHNLFWYRHPTCEGCRNPSGSL